MKNHFKERLNFLRDLHLFDAKNFIKIIFQEICFFFNKNVSNFNFIRFVPLLLISRMSYITIDIFLKFLKVIKNCWFDILLLLIFFQIIINFVAIIVINKISINIRDINNIDYLNLLYFIINLILFLIVTTAPTTTTISFLIIKFVFTFNLIFMHLFIIWHIHLN